MSDLPLRASDAGPDDSSTPPDWCDWLYEADEYNKLARHSVKGPQRLQWTRMLECRVKLTQMYGELRRERVTAVQCAEASHAAFDAFMGNPAV